MLLRAKHHTQAQFGGDRGGEGEGGEVGECEGPAWEVERRRTGGREEDGG